MFQRAAVVGSGPNGLTAAIVLAKAGVRTTLFEAESSIGGGTRTCELTLPGFRHDVCSAAHPMARSSPIFASFPLQQFGLEWIDPPMPVAHPLDDGTAGVLFQNLDETCADMGDDGPRYRRAIAYLVHHWTDLAGELLRPIHVPTHIELLVRFGMLAAWPADVSARSVFRSNRGRALFAGIAAHSVMPLDAIGSGAFAWVLAIAAHAVGWPIVRGGSQQLANALAAYFESLGGEIVTNTRIRSLNDLPKNALALLDVTPKQFLDIARDRLPDRFRRKLQAYRYGPGVFKMDWALRQPIPWKALECGRAGTVHVGGSLEEIAFAERDAINGTAPERPFVLLTQPSLFDSSRAPDGQHTAWAYCHVPNGSSVDMSARIESQIERFAPGFRSTILKRHCLTPAEMEQHNANLVGGDIVGGAHTLKQILLRPTPGFYRTPLEGVFLCSASTPPGGGVHGMCGHNAAQLALRLMRK